MNLLEVRTQARKESGRYDLINEDGTDNGFDFHLQQGQKWLDRKILHQKSAGRVFRLLEVGEYFVSFPLCRAIKEVWVATATARTQLEKMTIQDFRVAYPNQWGDVGTGTPLYYTPAFLRAVPETESVASANFDAIVGYTDIMVGKNYEYNGVLLAPRVDQQFHVEVWGYFYTEKLESDTDENYWSVEHPDILIMGALRQLEVFNRNTQGRVDWEGAIDQMLFDIDKDMVEEETSEIDAMEG